MATATVDVGYLAASYSVPESTLHSLLSEPTVELVQSLLIQIEARAREFEDLQSEKLKADVELDNAVQSGEQRARALKAAAEKAHREAAELQQKLAQEATARQQLEAELHALQTSTATSATQVQALESRVRTLEAQNRDAIATYDSKTAAYDRLAQELSKQHQKFVDQRKALSALEEKNQTLESAATNFKFRETNLQQEIELLRKNTAWYEAELKTRSADNTKFRKEKNAQVADLQRANADAAETIDSLQRTETLLRKHVEELKAKADEDRMLIQQLEDDAATNEANFRNELDNSKRLNAIQAKQAEITKNRLDEVTAELANLQESAAEEVGQLQADIDLERNRAAEAEERIANLESTIESLEREAAQLKTSGHVPSTPRRIANGIIYGTPGRAGSPAGSMTNTKIFAENSTLRDQLRDARNENEQKAALMQNMIDELEQLEPAVEELRRSNESLTTQIGELSSDLEDAVTEKDAARKEERKARGDLEGVHRECMQLRQNVQDLTVQLRSLLWRQQAAEQGLQSLTAEQQEFIVNSENNQLPEGQSYGDTATDMLISQHLVLYKNIADLQNQNANLLRTIHQVAQQHEGEEASNNKAQQEKDREELSRLRTRVQEYEDQLKSLNTRAHSYKKERDMYRQVATSRGLAPQESDTASAFGQSFNSQAPFTPMRGGGGGLQFNEQTPQVNHIPGVDKLVKDLQTQVDILKEESATDRATLKSQVGGLTKDNNQLQGERLRLDSQVRREQERYARLEGSIKMMESEKDTLQERYHNIQATLAKQDNKVVKAEQEAVDALARVEGLEHELTNLKASQSMWRTIEARLTERNQELVDERDRLSKMVTEVHKLRNEQELATAENRRRLQDRVDSLENELQSAQRKLDDEISEHKKATMQRDYERTEAQRRIDDLVKAKNEADVRCASAEAARQQLEQRVDELQSQLQSAEERIQALRPLPSPQANGDTVDDEEAPSHEEELVAQVTELQRKLDRKQEDLDAAKAQIEGFQNIAQEAEEALNRAIETRDDLQAELENVQQEKDTVIADLQKRVDAISAEFTTTNGELVELRGQHEQDTLRLTQEKETLEAEIANLKTDVEDYKAEAERQTQYVKSQADIATRARQDYEHELAKHGETMNTLRALRDEYNAIKSEIAQFKAQAEAARTALEQNEEHWKSTQSQYESQLAEAKRSYDDMKQHNKTLLQQFDNYKAQINDLKSNRTTIASGDANGDGSNSNKLDEITTFLKSEKDALEIQLAMRDQEAKRLDSKLTHTQNQLDQMREKLHAEQSRKQTPGAGTDLSKLQKQIEDYNLIRESNTTLRNDTARLEAKLAEKTTEIENLHNEMEPLKTRIEELEGELELAQGYYEQEQKQRIAIEERYNKFLHRSEQIDPRELEALKKSAEDVQSERDQLAEQVNDLNAQITSLQDKVKTHGGDVDAAVAAAVEAAAEAAKVLAREDAKAKFNIKHKQLMDAQKKRDQAVIDSITAERNELQTVVTTLQQELETSRQQTASAQAEASEAHERLTALQQQLDQVQSELGIAQQEVRIAEIARDEAVARASAGASSSVDMNQDEEDGQIHEAASHNASQQLANLQQKLEEMKTQLAEAQNRAFSAENQYSSLRVKESFLRDQITKLEQDDAEKSNRVVELQQQLTAAENKPSQSTSDVPVAVPGADEALSAEIQKLKQELAEAHQALADSRKAAAAEAHASQSSESKDAQFASMKADIEEREAKLAELEQAVAQREVAVTKREGQADTLKSRANEMVSKKKAEFAAEVDKLKAEHQAELERAKQATQPAAAPIVKSVSEEALKATPSSTSIPSTDYTTVQAIPDETASDQQVRIFIRDNPTARDLFQHNMRKRVLPVTEENGKLKVEVQHLKTENETLKKQGTNSTAIKSEGEQEQTSSGHVEAALAKAKADFEKQMDAKEKQHKMHLNAKTSLLKNGADKWNYIQEIAKATPTMEVAKAVEEAKKPRPQPTTPAQPPSQAQPPVASVAGQVPAAPTPSQPQRQHPNPAANNVSQANGTTAPAPVQVSQPAFSQPSNPFLPANQGTGPGPFAQAGQSAQQNTFTQAGQGSLPNPFIAAQQSRGLPIPGTFGGQAQRQAQQQQSQLQQPQQQKGGRGRGDGMGTGPGALQNLIGNQSGIPRGGSNIPAPGGGRGRGAQQQLLQQSQLPQINTQNHNASQIGRGGNRGSRGPSRGGAQPNQSSPRGSLNPGAQQFQPGPHGMGRGQKRGAEDEGDGGGRGGKRPRGRGQGAASGE